MRFARIEMLFLIWLVPVMALVFAYGGRKRRRIMGRFCGAGALAVIAGGVAPGRRRAGAGLLLGAILMVAVALAGPRHGFEWIKLEQRGVDLIIALDCSKSMLAQDIAPTRLDRAKREIQDLLGMLEGDRVGLAAFAGTAFLQCPLTLDYSGFNLFLDALTPDYPPVGGTDLVAAMETALSGFDPNSAADRAIILITDGEHTGRDDPVAMAERLKTENTRLYCVGVGGEQGAPVPDPAGGFKKDAGGEIVLTRLDEATLKRMAMITGGAYARSVAGDMDLDLIYKEQIRKTMAAAEVAEGRKQVWRDRFQWFLALAVAALFLEMMLPAGVRKPAAAGARILCWLVLPMALALLTGPLSATARADALDDGLDAYRNGDFDTALKMLTEAQLDAPDRPDILYNIGNARYRLGRYEAAADAYRQAAEAAEAAKAGETASLKQKALYNMGNALFRGEDLKGAVEQFEAALAMDPNDTSAADNLAFAKKLLAEQKPPPPQDGQDQQDDQDGEKGENDPEDKDQGENGQQREADQSDADRRDDEKQDGKQTRYGSEMKEDDKAAAEGEDAAPDEEKEAEAQAAQAGNPDQPPDQAPLPGAAARMLDRLKDAPGRAMVPAYGERRVEKDW